MSRKKRNKGRLADKFGGVEGTNMDYFSAGKEKKKKIKMEEWGKELTCVTGTGWWAWYM
jgi:hypothetical protein